MQVAIWHGTTEALRDLQDAVNRNCTCKDAQQACPAHKMLADQATLDHLAFAATLHDQLERSEWQVKKRAA